MDIISRKKQWLKDSDVLVDNRTHHIVCLGSEDLPTDDQGESWWKVFWKTDWSSGDEGEKCISVR